ncbi:MAG TPA: hypothetical protein VJ826_13990 [Candidatus Polarisedimenticolaceae bacterium]|nr:hypothetical protein [Candidatus Polarisedimenticolaceae bacterium]
MKRKVLTALVFVFALATALALKAPAEAAGGGCGKCPKTTPVCCRNCDGSPAFCARSFAFCPECPAP